MEVVDIGVVGVRGVVGAGCNGVGRWRVESGVVGVIGDGCVKDGVDCALYGLSMMLWLLFGLVHGEMLRCLGRALAVGASVIGIGVMVLEMAGVGGGGGSAWLGAEG